MYLFYNDLERSVDEDCYNDPIMEPIPNTDEEWFARRKRWEERRWLGEPEVVADDWLFKTYTLEDFGEF